MLKTEFEKNIDSENERKLLRRFSNACSILGALYLLYVGESMYAGLLLLGIGVARAVEWVIDRPH